MTLVAHDVSRPGLGLAISCTTYDSTVTGLLHRFKEFGSIPLGKVMARSMAEAVAKTADSGTAKAALGEGNRAIVLVPAPSRPKATRRRGFAPAPLLAGLLAKRLRAQGFSATVWNGLRVQDSVADQSVLGRAQRKANLMGKMRVVSAPPKGSLVLLDDIVTTGATLVEAKRALTEAGLTVWFAVTFAETL